MVSLRSLFVGAALIVAPVMAALSSDQLVERITDLTEKTKNFEAVMSTVNSANAPMIAAGQGPFPV
jgi:hypothetical protein